MPSRHPPHFLVEVVELAEVVQIDFQQVVLVPEAEESVLAAVAAEEVEAELALAQVEPGLIRPLS
ncbi:hypothetical protein D3C72_2461630 [compost metagenome]